jgi:hypothetical protein
VLKAFEPKCFLHVLFARIETPSEQRFPSQQQRYLIEAIEALTCGDIIEVGDVNSVVEYVVAALNPQQSYCDQRILEASGEAIGASGMLKVLQTTTRNYNISALGFD